MIFLQNSLTWEKRLSLGSSAPSNICATLEEQQPTRRKESHILEGLRKLQRRKHRSSSTSSKVSKSGYKDCMNSNEGIYSLGSMSSHTFIRHASSTSELQCTSVCLCVFLFACLDFFWWCVINLNGIQKITYHLCEFTAAKKTDLVHKHTSRL